MIVQPLVSVLIPAYNAENWIGEAIDSCLNQSWTNIEIIVVNDGSVDATWSVVQRYSAQQRVILIDQLNKGASAARNRAFQESKGQFIQYLDADDLLDREKIAIQMKRVLATSENYLHSSEWSFFYTNELKEKNPIENPLFKDFDSPVNWLIEAWTKKAWMQPSAWLVPRKLIDAAGPWNEQLSLHDDGEFFCRVLLQSKGVKFSEGAKSYYRKGIESSLSGQVSRRAVISHFTVCELYTRYVLQKENSSRTKKACATNYQDFQYTYYPFYSKYTHLAANEVKRLGGSDSKIAGGPVFLFFVKLAGWKLAKRMQIATNKLK